MLLQSSRLCLLRLDPADRVSDEGCRVLEFQLRFDVAAMHLHRLRAEVEFLRNLARALALADELEHLKLPVAKLLDG